MILINERVSVLKILFFPNYLGGGFGHICRCLALADALSRRGGSAEFALNGPHIQNVINAGYGVHRLFTPKQSSQKGNRPAYLYVPSMAYQIVRDGFDNRRTVRRALSEACRITEKVKPDILVGDGYLLTNLIGRAAGIPVVQLVKSVVHPQPKPMVWWENEPDNIILPDPCPVFNPVLRENGLSEITAAEQLLSGDLLLIPSIPELDPLDPLPADTYYVGPIVRSRDVIAQLPPWFSTLGSDGPVIYVTVGGAADYGAGKAFYKIICDALGNAGWSVVVSTGGKDEPVFNGPVPSNIRFTRWVPGTVMTAYSDLVIFHGGYTRIEILKHGLPSIVIPFHSEQEHYGRLMQKAGVSKLLQVSDEPYASFMLHWKGGNFLRKSKSFTVHVKKNVTLRPEKLRELTESILSNRLIYEKAQNLKIALDAADGAEKAIYMIESSLMT